MYTATVLIEIEQFVPMSTGAFAESTSIKAKIYPPTDTSPPPAPPVPVFSGDGQKILITVPKGYDGSVQLTYQLPEPKYVFIGVAFKNPNGGVGCEEFRDSDIYRDPYGSELTVTDSCINEYDNVTFAYVLVIQEVATAALGIIDPDVETQTTEE